MIKMKLWMFDGRRSFQQYVNSSMCLEEHPKYNVFQRRNLYTGCPKIKLAFGKHLEISTHGFKMCILYVKRDKLGPNPSRPLIGHP